MRKLIFVMMAGMLLWSGAQALAADGGVQAELQALQQRVAELEAQQSEEAVQSRNAELMREMMAEIASSGSVAANTGVTAGYDKHFFIKSMDDQFLLNIGTRLQFRHTYMLTDDGDKKLNADGTRAVNNAGVDSSGNAFEIERARLQFSGHVMKDLKYYVQVDLDDDDNDFGQLQDYYIKYSFMPELGVQVGRTKGAFGKQENTSSGRQMFVDRSLANEVFNIGYGTGVEFFGATPLADTSMHYRFGIYNDFQDEGASPFADNDNNPALAARVEIPLMGASTKDFANESDLAYHDNMVAMVGMSYGYANARTEDSFAGQAGDNYEVLAKSGDGLANIYELGGECNMFGADLSMKYMGLSVNLEGWYQHLELDSKEVAFEQDFGAGRNGFGIDGLGVDNYGWNAQAGYFIVPKTFELVSRVSGVHVDSTNDSYEYAGGWNWYLSGQVLKLSMDISYIDDLPLASSSANLAGVQNNSLLMVRSQLQLQF